MNYYNVVARINRRTAQYRVLAADASMARRHVTADIADRFPAGTSVLFLGTEVAR